MEARHSRGPDAQKKRITAFLDHQRTGVLCCAGYDGLTDPSLVSALPVWYRLNTVPSDSGNLEVDCLVPRWADIAYYLGKECRVVLIVQASSGAGLRWVQIRGFSQTIRAPDWARLLPRWVSALQPDALYLVVRVLPTRIDLVDEDLGWGVQETLEW